jgi:hypothetical protein
MSLMFLIMALLSLFWPSRAAAAANIYFAQTAQGANNGADCADAFAYNDGNNGINKSVNWAPGNTLHVCGTITVGAGQNIISAQASGTSTSPITIKFEPGAILQAPYFGSGGTAGIYLSGKSWIVVDGGNTGSATGSSFPTPPTLWTGGLIQNYANGTAGQSNCPGINNTYTGACSNQVASNTHAIEAMGVNNVTIQNLGPCVIAVVTAGNFNNGAPGADCLRIQGSNILITNNQFVWDGACIDNNTYGNDSNFEVSHNYFEECGWGVVTAGGAVTATNFSAHDNWFHDFGGWNGTGAHINGLYAYNGSGGGISSYYLYNNVFYGNMGSGGWTSWAHFGNDSAEPGKSWTNGAGLQAWNNLCVTCLPLGNGCFEMNGGSGNNLYNNTFLQTGSASCGIQAGTGGGSTSVDEAITARNNIFSGFTTFECMDSGVISFTASNNVYANVGSGGGSVWNWPGHSANTLAAWQSACGCDAGSIGQLSSALSNITAYGYISTGFVGIGIGADLAGVATGDMASLTDDSSFGGTRNPGIRTIPWTVGAYQSNSSAGSQPAAPLDLTASVSP